VGKDLLLVVEESRSSSKVLGETNSTFSSLIPKKDALEFNEYFKPIYLCNDMYKIISKIIAIRLKHVLSPSILGEKFELLDGRKIHEAI
jgi:hypothetical protein